MGKGYGAYSNFVVLAWVPLLACPAVSSKHGWTSCFESAAAGHPWHSGTQTQKILFDLRSGQNNLRVIWIVKVLYFKQNSFMDRFNRNRFGKSMEMTNRRRGWHMPKVNRGFTLVELLVVIAIIGVLVALLLPAI